MGRAHGSRPECHEGVTTWMPAKMPAHVRDRSHSRSGRCEGLRRRPADDRGAAAPRARWGRGAAHRPGDPRPHPPGDHRRGGRRPAARVRGRRDHPDRQRRDLQPRRATDEARGARPSLRHRLRLRGDRARIRGERSRLRARAERHVRLRALGRPPPAPGGRPRRVRRQAAVLVERRPVRGGRLRDRRPARGRRGRANRGPRRPRPLPGLSLRPRAAHSVRGDQQAARRLDPDRRGGRDAAGGHLARAAR